MRCWGTVRSVFAVAIAFSGLVVLSGCSDGGPAAPPTPSVGESDAPRNPNSSSVADAASKTDADEKAPQKDSTAGTPTPSDDTLKTPANPGTEESKRASKSPGKQETKSAASEPKRESIGDIVNRLDDAVVFITVSDALGETQGVGTGCIVSRTGLVVTNHHVVADAVGAQVQLKDGSKHDVVGYCGVDKSRDLAILKVEGLPELTEYFELKPPPKLRQGDKLLAIGHPMEFSFTVSDGIVSALRTTAQLPELYQQGLHSNPDTEWIQTTAAISNGSSGGPLLTERGELVGINTWMGAGQNLGFAINVKHIVELVEQLDAEVHEFPLPESSVITSPRVARMLNDFAREYQTLFANARAAGTVDAAREVIARQNPVPMYLEKCLETMTADPQHAEAVDAILLAHQIWGSAEAGLKGGKRHLDQMYELAAAEITDEADVRRIVLGAGVAPYSKSLERFLRGVFHEHKSPELRARAAYALVVSMSNVVPPEPYYPEVVELLERLERDFADVKIDGTPLRETVRQSLAGFSSLYVGAVAQPIQGKDLDGKPFRLSDYKGKVVVLDFWADWCPHCRAMYQHERQLVERLKDKPFVLLGVNCDAAPDRPRALVKSKQVTWRSWYDAADGEIQKQWQVTSFPTVYVLDREGRIRFQNTRGEELDTAVEALLEEDLLRLPEDVVAAGAEWSFYASDDPPPADWTAADFDDTPWKSGVAPFGYGADVKTIVPAGGDDQSRRITTWFRKSFEIDRVETLKHAILKMRIDDGVVVYLNGREVYRSNLPDEATSTTPAVRHARPQPHYASIDPGLFLQGRNVFAVEVHQASDTSADMQFEMSASSTIPEFEPILAAKSVHTRLQLCRLLAHIETADEAVDKCLQSLAKDDDSRVRLSAAIAQVARQPQQEIRLDAPKDAQERQMRLAYAAAVNQSAWRIVSETGYSATDYRRLMLSAKAARALVEQLKDKNELAQIRSTIANTLGVAQFRAKQYEQAIATCRASMKIAEDPIGLSYIAMSQKSLGKVDDAKKTLARAESLAKTPRWKGDDSAAQAYAEASAYISQP